MYRFSTKYDQARLSEHKNTSQQHFSYTMANFHTKLDTIVLVERFLVSFPKPYIHMERIYHFSFDIWIQTHTNTMKRDIFPIIPFSRFVTNTKSKVIFHTVNSYSLLYIMCPIFIIDNWIGLDCRDVCFSLHIKYRMGYTTMGIYIYIEHYEFELK